MRRSCVTTAGSATAGHRRDVLLGVPAVRPRCLSGSVTAYDPAFLGPVVPLPARAPGLPGRVVELGYTHFTVLLRPDRRLAVATAVNVDGSSLRDVSREGVGWRLDERVAERHQAGEEVYARNDLDRGHLVRRRDAVWGDPVTAGRANADTFHYTNAAPQVAAFNQSKDLWLGLEDYVLGHADATRRRLTVLTGPVLADDDPPYRGLAVPRRFWKVVAWSAGGALAATGYLLDQSALLERFLARERARAAGAALPRKAEPGAFRTFQVRVSDVAAAAGLVLGPLSAADRFAPDLTASGLRRTELSGLEDVVL